MMFLHDRQSDGGREPEDVEALADALHAECSPTETHMVIEQDGHRMVVALAPDAESSVPYFRWRGRLTDRWLAVAGACLALRRTHVGLVEPTRLDLIDLSAPPNAAMASAAELDALIVPVELSLLERLALAGGSSLAAMLADPCPTPVNRAARILDAGSGDHLAIPAPKRHADHSLPIRQAIDNLDIDRSARVVTPMRLEFNKGHSAIVLSGPTSSAVELQLLTAQGWQQVERREVADRSTLSALFAGLRLVPLLGLDRQAVEDIRQLHLDAISFAVGPDRDSTELVDRLCEEIRTRAVRAARIHRCSCHPRESVTVAGQDGAAAALVRALCDAAGPWLRTEELLLPELPVEIHDKDRGCGVSAFSVGPAEHDHVRVTVDGEDIVVPREVVASRRCL